MFILIWTWFQAKPVWSQQEPREYQRWGKFGVGKLVTTQKHNKRYFGFGTCILTHPPAPSPLANGEGEKTLPVGRER